MKLKIAKILTLIISVSYFNLSFAEILSQEKFKKHLRWNLQLPKDQIVIKKHLKSLEIQTLDLKTFEQLKSTISALALDSKYFQSFSADVNNFPEYPASIRVLLSNEEVEVFTFYRKTDDRYVIDFWVDEKEETKKERDITENSKKQNQEERKIRNENINQSKLKPEELSVNKDPKISEKGEGLPGPFVEKGEYRDFRYGASFIWDYEPLSPEIAEIINLERKTAEHFYEIKDRDLEKNGSEQETHMQLTINLYRKKKWGLMSKSIELYDKKYGDDKNSDLNKFLKANAILRKSIETKDEVLKKTAIKLYISLVEDTNDYELKTAILKYLVQVHLKSKNYISSLEVSKKLYIYSKENFDEELANYAATVIILNLTKLNQVEKLQQFINELAIRKSLNRHVFLSYKFYLLLKNNNEKEIIREFEKENKNLSQPIHSSILFNVAEAYFRLGKYEEAIKYFDLFVVNYSFMSSSSHARLRIALAYDLLGKDEKVVLGLYENAINKAVDPVIKYEAQIRYVGIKHSRKKILSPVDLESIVFLEHNVKSVDLIPKELKKILWLVRLRTLINEKKYEKALSYLKALPFHNMKPLERRVFEGDGSEILYGLLLELFQNGEFSRIVEFWEAYKKKFIEKSPVNPYLNYIISYSFLNLNLKESFDKSLDNLKKLKTQTFKTFPQWIEDRSLDFENVEFLADQLELNKLMAEGQWLEAYKKVQVVNQNNGLFKKKSFFLSIIFYNLKDYQKANSEFESYILENDKTLNLEKHEIYSFFTSYIETLLALGKFDKFKSSAEAILTDLKRSNQKNPFLQKLKERLLYLAIEFYMGEGEGKGLVKAEEYIKLFQEEFSNSSYRGRIAYLLGTIFVKDKREGEGIKVFESIIDDQSIPGYIRELAKTELSSLKIKQMNI